MQKGKWRSGKSVFFSWIVSYFVILFVPVLLSIAVYNESEKIIHNEINRANAAILKQVQQSIDGQMTNIEHMATDISLNKRIRSVLYPQYVDSFYRYQLLEVISKELKYHSIDNDFIDKVFIYLKNSNIVLSQGTYYSSDVAFKEVQKVSKITHEEWDHLLQQGHHHTCMTLSAGSRGKEGSIIVYLHSFPSEGRDAATIIVLLNSKCIDDILSSTEWIAKGSFFILDKSNRVITSQNSKNLSATSDVLEYRIYPHTNHVSFVLDSSSDMVISYIDSDIMNWKYISTIPESVFLEKVNYIQKYAVLSLILCMVAGGIISFFFAKKNYHPLEELIVSLKDSIPAGDPKNDNEYHFIQGALNNILEEKESIHRKLDQQNDEMRMSFLRRLLSGKIKVDDEFFRIAESYHIHFHSNYYAIILFHIEQYDRLFYGEENITEESKLDLMNYVISNVVEEITNQNHQGYIVEMDHFLACLTGVCLTEATEAKKEILDIAKNAKRLVENYLYTTLTISVSNVHDSLAGFPEAYQEAIEAMEYRMVIGVEQIIQYNSIRHPNYNYSYPMDVEYKLINTIKSGDLTKARDMVNLIISNNLDDGILSVDMARCLMFNLVSTMIKTMNEFSETSDQELLQTMHPVERTEEMLKCNTIMEMKEYMESTLEDICGCVERKKQSHNSKLKDDIINFINENYSCPEMSNAMIAEHFSIHPAYLSRFFKEQTGEKVLDYINKLRMQTAKQMLQESRCKIEEVAQKLGYNNSVSFIRVFKKYEGTTPGKYRDTMRDY